MSGTAPLRLVPDPSPDDGTDDTHETSACVRLAVEDDDRCAPQHVFGAPLALDRTD